MYVYYNFCILIKILIEAPERDLKLLFCFHDTVSFISFTIAVLSSLNANKFTQQGKNV